MQVQRLMFSVPRQDRSLHEARGTHGRPTSFGDNHDAQVDMRKVVGLILVELQQAKLLQCYEC